jgi:hypothetical protein
METKDIQPDLSAIEIDLKKIAVRFSRQMFHMPTPQHKFGNHGIGFTRKNKDQSKKSLKAAKLSRKINHKISNKKSRPTGSKKRI